MLVGRHRIPGVRYSRIFCNYCNWCHDNGIPAQRRARYGIRQNLITTAACGILNTSLDLGGNVWSTQTYKLVVRMVYILIANTFVVAHLWIPYRTERKMVKGQSANTLDRTTGSMAPKQVTLNDVLLSPREREAFPKAPEGGLRE